jgi:hypothetical protein
MDARVVQACAKDIGDKEVLTEELRCQLLQYALEAKRHHKMGFVARAAKRFKKGVEGVPLSVAGLEAAAWALVKRHDRLPVEQAVGSVCHNAPPRFFFAPFFLQTGTVAVALPTVSVATVPAVLSPPSSSSCPSPDGLWICPGCNAAMHKKGSGRHIKTCKGKAVQRKLPVCFFPFLFPNASFRFQFLPKPVVVDADDAGAADADDSNEVFDTQQILDMLVCFSICSPWLAKFLLPHRSQRQCLKTLK